MARLWQQRLQEEGIPCVVKSLGAGYGAWGGNTSMPHALYVLSSDRLRAIGVIRGTDSPEYLLDFGATAEEEEGSRTGRFLLILAVAILGIAILAAISTTVR